MPSHLLFNPLILQPARLNGELNHRLHFLLTALLAAALPVYPAILPPIIALLILNWLAGGRFRHLTNGAPSLWHAMLAVSLYLLYTAGLAWSDNLHYGLKDLETKLSLFVFPLVYSTSGEFNAEQLKKIFRAFIAGCLAAALICFGYAAGQYLLTRYKISEGLPAWNYGINFFLKERLSLWIHPSYRAMYFVFALILLPFANPFPGVSSRKAYAIGLVLSLFIFLFNSKAGILSLFMLIVVVLFKIVFKEKKYTLALAIASLFAASFFLLYRFSDQFAFKINSTIQTLSGATEVKKSDESTASRIALWNAAGAVISQNWLTGTGTGDVKDALLKEYEKEGMTFALQENLNAHNQFLQTFAAVGISGLLLLCVSIAAPVFPRQKKITSLHIGFILLITINFFVESMLETQAGVIFYGFFNSLLLFSNFSSYDSVLPSQNNR